MAHTSLSPEARSTWTAQTSAHLERHLTLALAIARRRAWRDSAKRELLDHVAVQPLAAEGKANAAAITFSLPSREQPVQRYLDWDTLLYESPAQTATFIASLLRSLVDGDRRRAAAAA